MNTTEKFPRDLSALHEMPDHDEARWDPSMGMIGGWFVVGAMITATLAVGVGYLVFR